MENKRSGLNSIISEYRNNRVSGRVFEASQSTFAGIRGSPFTYWYGADVLSIFDDSKNFDEVVSIESGVKTGNNDKLLRKAWEVPPSEIGDRYRASIRSENSLPYHDETTYLVDWKGKGSYIEKQGEKHGNQYFFGDKSRIGEECAAFQKNSKYFVSRYVKKGEIPDNQMYRVHPDSGDMSYINGWMNSALIRYVIEGFNPSANFQKYDVKRLPFKQDDGSFAKVKPLHNLIVAEIDEKSAHNEETLQFSPSKFYEVLDSDIQKAISQIWEKDKLAEAARLVAGGLIDEEIMKVYDLNEDTREKIYSEILSNPSRFPHVENSGQIRHELLNDKIDTIRLDEQEYQSLVNAISNSKPDDLREISEAHEISPYTVVNIFLKENQCDVTSDEEITARVVSYLLGELLGRWDSENEEPIFVFEAASEEVDSQIQQILDDHFKRPRTARTFIESNLGRSIEDWLRNRFFRYHHANKYTRRGQRIPVYWQLESPEGAFSCFLYYHNIDQNTLPKLRGQYIDSRIGELENELKTLSSQINQKDPDKKMVNRKKRVENNLNDIRTFRETIDQMINEGLSVDVEDGIWENIKEWDQYEIFETGLPKLKSSYSR